MKYFLAILFFALGILLVLGVYYEKSFLRFQVTEDSIIFLQGEWTVTSVKASSSGVQARGKNDPEFLGRKLIVGTGGISFHNQNCRGPRLKSIRMSSDVWFADTFGTTPKDYGLEMERVRILDIVTITCRSGDIGPKAAGNSTIAKFSDKQIGMSYFDGTLLILERSP